MKCKLLHIVVLFCELGFYVCISLIVWKQVYYFSLGIDIIEDTSINGSGWKVAAFFSCFAQSFQCQWIETFSLFESLLLIQIFGLPIIKWTHTHTFSHAGEKIHRETVDFQLADILINRNNWGVHSYKKHKLLNKNTQKCSVDVNRSNFFFSLNIFIVLKMHYHTDRNDTRCP